MRTITCFGNRTSGTLLIIGLVSRTKIIGLSDEDNSVSRSDNFVNVNVLCSVTSSRVLSHRISKLYKKRRINI